MRRSRPSLMTPARCRRLAKLVARHPDATLEELRDSLHLTCSVSTIHVALAAMKLTYKKRRSMPASKSART
ncbi:MAG TPA: hypothetical protein VK970_20065 [Candidatus Methylacidiphilales bacterium]|nr:hypothetical protein [Candidatus Methylacidiphilales bacterium]